MPDTGNYTGDSIDLSVWLNKFQSAIQSRESIELSSLNKETLADLENEDMQVCRAGRRAFTYYADYHLTLPSPDKQRLEDYQQQVHKLLARACALLESSESRYQNAAKYKESLQTKLNWLNDLARGKCLNEILGEHERQIVAKSPENE